MALTEDRKALVETILNTLREDPSLLEEFRRLLVPEIVVFLPDLKLIAERQAALEERLTRELSAVWEAINALRAEVAELRQEVRSVAERQERMEKRLDQIEQRQEQMEQRMERMEQRQERMEERQDRMEQRQDRMERRLQRLETDVGHLKGTVKEITYRTNFLGYFGFWVLSAEDPWRRLWEKIEEALQEGMLTQDELTDLRSADLLWLGFCVAANSRDRKSSSSLSFRGRFKGKMLNGHCGERHLPERQASGHSLWLPAQNGRAPNSRTKR